MRTPARRSSAPFPPGSASRQLSPPSSLTSPRGCELLLVKTLADAHPSPEYARTRAFYRAMGFRPLTVLPDHWDAANPCLLMVRTV